MQSALYHRMASDKAYKKSKGIAPCTGNVDDTRETQHQIQLSLYRMALASIGIFVDVIATINLHKVIIIFLYDVK